MMRKKIWLPCCAAPANAIDQLVVGFLKFDLPLPTQEEPEILQTKMTVQRKVDLWTPQLEGPVVAEISQTFPRDYRLAFEALRAIDDGSNKDGPRQQKSLRKRWMEYTDQMAARLDPQTRILSLSDAKRQIRRQRELAKTKGANYDIPPYLDKAEEMHRQSENFANANPGDTPDCFGK